MNKKSQGLSVNLIIIVAIALVVLIVMIAIFTGKLGDWVGQTKEANTCRSACEGIGSSKGTDSDTAATCSGKYLPGDYGDVATDKFCCCT